MLIVNDVASVGRRLYRGFQVKFDEVDFYQPLTNAITNNRLLLFIHRLALPLLLFFRSRGHLTLYFHYATLSYYSYLVRSKLVVHCHGTDLRENLNNCLRKKTLRALTRSHLIFYSTPDLSQYIPEEIRYKSRFIPNPIEVDFFSPAEKQIRQRQGITVFIISKLDRTKGVNQLLKIINLLCEQPNICSVQAFSHGNSVADSLPQHEKLKWLPRLSQEQMRERFRSADMAIGQLQLGAIGVTELEAMSCGLPTIAHFEYDKAYEVSVPIVKASNAEEVMLAVDTLIDNQELREKIGRESRKFVLQNHELGLITDKILALFKEFNIKI